MVLQLFSFLRMINNRKEKNKYLRYLSIKEEVLKQKDVNEYIGRKT